MEIFIAISSKINNECSREIVNYIMSGMVYVSGPKSVICGRRCLAALNKFHKIQRTEIERIRDIVLTDSLTRVILI